MNALIQLLGDLVRGEADAGAAAVVIGVLGLAGFVLYCVRFVREGEQAAILRFGRFRKVVGPGFVLIGPPWRSLERIHIRQTSIRLAPQAVLVRDGVVFNVVGVLVYRITDVYKALFEIAELPAAIADVGAGKLREVVGSRTASEMWDIQALRAAIMGRLRVQEEQWGVAIIDFLLVNVEPSGAAQQVFLLEELARRRVEAARLMLEGFRLAAAEVGLPPRPDSPLWAAMAGAAVTATAFPESGTVDSRAGRDPGGTETPASTPGVEEQIRQLRKVIEERLEPDSA